MIKPWTFGWFFLVVIICALIGCSEDDSPTDPTGGSAIPTHPVQLSNFGENGRGFGSGLSWSPSGDELAYSYQDTIFAISIESSSIRVLNIDDEPGFRGISGTTTWSPDGEAIVAVRREDSSFGVGYNLFLYPTNGSDPERLTDLDPASAHSPQWSNSGRFIGYVTGADFHVLDMITKVDTDLTDDNFGSLSSFCWSPDDQKVAIVHGYSNIFTLSIADGDTTQIVSDVHYTTGVDWTNRGDRLFFFQNEGLYLCWNIPATGRNVPVRSYPDFEFQYPNEGILSPDCKTIAVEKDGEIWILPAEQF